MKRRLLTICTAAVLLVGASTTTAMASSERLSDADFDRAVAEYFAEHPGDWAGAADYIEGLGGTLAISGADGTITTPEAATAAYEAAGGATPRFNSSGPGFVTPLAWPQDAYVAFVGVTANGPNDSTVTLVGAWNFKDEFIGQGPPVDIAGLAINKTCGTWGGYAANTYTYEGTDTDVATLRSGGVGTSGPVWNIADYISNFMSYADAGNVLAIYDRSSCPASEWESIQGEFIYEGNSGGSIIGISIGWGLFNVDYNDPGQFLTRSSGAMTVEYPN